MNEPFSITNEILFLSYVKGCVTSSKRKPNSSAIQGSGWERWPSSKERQKGLKVPYSRDLFLKEVTNWFSCCSKTNRVDDISFVTNLHLQAQLLCESPVVSVLALQPFTPLGKE